MNFTDFLNDLASKLEGKLIEVGFKRINSDRFVRFNEDHDVNIIFIQKHSTNALVSVSFGVHYDFLPKISSTDFPTVDDIELPDCEFKHRVTPDLSVRDYWWSVNEQSVNEIFELVLNRQGEFFEQFNINSLIGNISPQDLEGALPGMFDGVTKIRACLILASINEFKNKNDLAAEFASHGIKVAGMAVGPKKKLKQILKRVQS